MLVPPSVRCGTPAPGRRHNGTTNDPSCLLQPTLVHRDVVGFETRVQQRITEPPGNHQQRACTHHLSRHATGGVDPDNTLTRDPETDSPVPGHLDTGPVPAQRRRATQPDTASHHSLLPPPGPSGGNIAPPSLVQQITTFVRNIRERRELDALFARLPAPAVPHTPDTQSEEHDHQQRQQQPVHHTIFPSRAVTRPRRIVARTTPGNRIPS